jgi:hypothetical protein
VTRALDTGCNNEITETGDVAPGDTYTVCVEVQVPDDAQDGEIDDQVLTVTSQTKPSVTDTATVTAIAVTKHVLLVDDDGNAPDVQSYYTDALDANGVNYGVWDLAAHDELMPQGLLNAYDTVYWTTGAQWPEPLTKYGDVLSNYLDNGNNLFLSGQDLLDQAGGTTDFVHDYLHVDWDGSDDQNDLKSDKVFGIDGTVIGDPFTAGVPLVEPAGYDHFEDEVTPIDGAVAQFNDHPIDGSDPGADAVAVGPDAGGTNYKVVFLAFPFEAFGTDANRAEMVQQTQDYFTPAP